METFLFILMLIAASYVVNFVLLQVIKAVDKEMYMEGRSGLLVLFLFSFIPVGSTMIMFSLCLLVILMKLEDATKKDSWFNRLLKKMGL